jgi:putative ABC transport system substrate-binding protein
VLVTAIALSVPMFRFLPWAYSTQLASRQLEVLHDLVPKAAIIGVLMNPNARAPRSRVCLEKLVTPADRKRVIQFANAEPQVRDLRDAGNALGLRLQVIEVGSQADLGTAFATLAGERADALFVTADGFFHNQLRDPIIALTARHRLPAMYVYRDCVAAGGLICYTSSIFDAARQSGVYAGRILKGARPADLPVTQPTKFELVINLKTAKALGLEVPDKLVALADEVIE